jgi:hypothetical protein
MSSAGLKSVLVPAAVGAAGGMALDVAWNYLSPYIPTQLTSSTYLTSATKIAAAFGLGLIARKFLGREKGNAVMAGAVTIQIYSAASMALSGTIPGLSGFGRMGAYMQPVSSAALAGLGSPNPAAYLQKPMGRLGRMGRMGAYMRNPVMAASPMSGLPFGGLGSVGGAGNSFDMF